MKDHLLVLSRYSRVGASSRLRTVQYRGWLQDAGFEVEYAALFDDKYLEHIYAGQTRRARAFAYYRQRFSKLQRASRPNLIWIEKEVFPWLPWMFDKAMLPRSVPIVCDYDDAVFHRYDCHRFALIRWILGSKIDRIMGHSRLITCGNKYLADRARRAGATRVEVVPTVIDKTRYSVRPVRPTESIVQVGWIGTPSTWVDYGKALYSQLDAMLVANRARFRAVGAKLEEESIGSLDIVPWREESEVSAIQSMDIGVMPLPDTPWERGKCGYKLIQYMACGLPVVASPVGVNRDLVEHGVNGFLAESEEDWHAAIRTLLGDSELRRRMGAAGRRKVEKQFTLQDWGPRVAGMLRRVVDEDQRA